MKILVGVIPQIPGKEQMHFLKKKKKSKNVIISVPLLQLEDPGFLPTTTPPTKNKQTKTKP